MNPKSKIQNPKSEDPYKYFKIEAEELVESLTKGLLSLEKRSEDPEIVKELFRYVHTLKGAANVIKLPHISKVAHRAEDRLALFRDEEKKVTPEDITLLLDAVAVLGEMVEAVKAGQPEDSVDTSQILRRLKGEESLKLKAQSSTEDKTSKVPAEPPQSEIGTIQNPKSKIQNRKSGRRATDKQQLLRIELTKMDRLTNLSNEILINHGRLKDIVETLEEAAKRSNKKGLLDKRLEAAFSDLGKGLDRSGAFSEEMNEIVMKTRLVSVAGHVYLFEKMVRDLGVENSKEVTFSVKGENLLLDRSLMEQVREPIYHMLRNCVIHGLEPATERAENGKDPSGAILLKFEKAGNNVRITCEDDGRGMDPETIRRIALSKGLVDPKSVDNMSDQDVLYLILNSGFSSVDILTESAGRGVGLDVVKNCASSLGGSLDIESEKGRFARFILTLPLSVNMIDVFMVDVLGQMLLLPLKNVLETRLIEESEISSEAGKDVIGFDGMPVSLVHLGDVLGLEAKESNRKKKRVVLVKGNKEILALIVDGFGGIKTILLKPLAGSQEKIRCVNAATILENGDPAFVLDIKGIFERITEIPTKREGKQLEATPPSVLVVDDSLTTRTLIDGILKGERYLVRLAKSGEEALDILENESFDLAMLDVEMPGINGFELAQKIRESPKDGDTPIVILSSRGGDADKRRGIEVGANAYIVKGAFDQGAFLETVKSLI